MPHGAPDYSNVKKEEYSIRLDDMGELAARLGSPLIYDRRGDVLFVDTFKDGFSPWTTSAQGTSSKVALDPIRFHTDGFSVLLRGGSDGNRLASLERALPLVNMQGVGLEIRSMINDDVEELRLLLYVYDGTSLFKSYIIYFPATDVLKLNDENDTEQTILSGVNLSTVASGFHFIKFTLDWVNKTYLRGLFNGVSVDISSYSIRQEANAASPRITFQVRVVSNDGDLGEAFVDNVILTRNED